MRGRGLLLALAFVLGLVALAWLTGDQGPWADNAAADEASEK